MRLLCFSYRVVLWSKLQAEPPYPTQIQVNPPPGPSVNFSVQFKNFSLVLVSLINKAKSVIITAVSFVYSFQYLLSVTKFSVSYHFHLCLIVPYILVKYKHTVYDVTITHICPNCRASVKYRPKLKFLQGKF